MEKLQAESISDNMKLEKENTDFLDRLIKVGFIPLLIFFIFIMLIPIYILVKISFSQPVDVLTQHPTFLIHNFTTNHWNRVLQSGNLLPAFSRSFSVATFTTILAVIIATPASYVISRLPKKAKYIIVLGLFFTRMFPNVGIALPIAVKFIRWNLLDTNVGLILAHLIEQLPFITWILVGTFEVIPVDLEKSAMIDGASRVRALWSVVLPNAAPGLAVASMFVWLNSWNEFTYALYLSLARNTLPLQVYYYVNRGGYFQMATYATILMIPVLIVTYALQRYIRSDYLGGAIKG
ncbi:carbohydrate ABC transporter permease [Alkaliphilus peptidifermentans]|uniref:Carbohydrate ABC transporter membrane protein 2, CUT1 family (TC 3.A.1.1.-) n=1 Tax=Alkaliphilus peptidifermentans DSM 18978 TaxID=1120976 RepID=A0A1G5JMS0_9FIRM|nr:carbohydrate ABC transporter permease [Alkaliphilus peptidifermentans]SCY89607.1 carbohydrate ABC transporter membrane protein 2, CUT1 family (TC 3.A.1.1.-) [Alkaliphilus peptidifermentans DSM 18978]